MAMLDRRAKARARAFWRVAVAPLGLTGAMLMLAGCSVFFRDMPVPIPTATTQANPAAQADTLVVFRPGRGGAMTDFQTHGFIDVLREAGVNADTVAVDSHLGYYFERTVIERLRDDVLLPARARGVRRIVLVGVSLGGLGALLNEREEAGTVDAIVLFAPYLGDKARLRERIHDAGGPGPWAAGRDPEAGGVAEVIWTYLGQKSAELPPTWLLYGRDDGYAQDHRMLATLLPQSRVKEAEGKHDWPTWRELWREVCLHSDLFAAEKLQNGQGSASESSAR